MRIRALHHLNLWTDISSTDPDSAADLQRTHELNCFAEALPGAVGWPIAPRLSGTGFGQGHYPATAFQPGSRHTAGHAAEHATHITCQGITGKATAHPAGQMQRCCVFE